MCYLMSAKEEGGGVFLCLAVGEQSGGLMCKNV